MEADRSRTQPLNRWRVVLGIAALVALAVVFSPRVTREMRDFEVYHSAAGRALDSAPLYRPEDGHFQFKYLPAFAVAAAPIALLPVPVAKTLWFGVSVALICTLVALSLSLLPERRRPTWLLVGVLIVAMGKFYGHELVLGQMNLLFGVLVVLGILAIRAGRDGLAAACCVAAVVVKPYAILFLPWLILTRGRRALAGVTMGVICVAAAPVLTYGVAGTIALHRAWWTTVTASTAPNLTNPDNVSVAAMFAKWLGAGGAASALAGATGLALLATAAFVVARGRGLLRRESLEGAMLLTMVPLLSPQGWDYVFLVATPAIAMLANYDDRLPRAVRALAWIAILTIGLSLFDLLGRQGYARFMSWSIITVCFFVVLASLTVLRVRGVA
ncbi:MAG: DUF2029 domain-containing protein [Acidobacteria bacterium]|nr:DUF2029 domain-containing protein [Acidobacteriota bacterium]